MDFLSLNSGKRQTKTNEREAHSTWSNSLFKAIIPCPPKRTKTNPRIARTSWSNGCSCSRYTMSAKADKNKSAHRAHFSVKWLLLQPLYRVCQSRQNQIGAKRIQLGQIAYLRLLYRVRQSGQKQIRASRALLGQMAAFAAVIPCPPERTKTNEREALSFRSNSPFRAIIPRFLPVENSYRL